MEPDCPDSLSVRTIWGVLTTEQTRVATLDEKKSSTGPALSLHSSGNTFAEQPRMTYKNGEKEEAVGNGQENRCHELAENGKAVQNVRAQSCITLCGLLPFAGRERPRPWRFFAPVKSEDTQSVTD